MNINWWYMRSMALSAVACLLTWPLGMPHSGAWFVVAAGFAWVRGTDPKYDRVVEQL